MPEIEKYKGVVLLWDYVPSLSLAIIFAVLFAIITALHGYKMLRTKMWFCIPFVVGGICEPIGYGCRALSHFHTASLTLYLLQALFILLPPVLFAATIYMIYSRVVRSVGKPGLSPISPLWCTRIFVLGDLVCLNIQSTGGGLTANKKLAKLGDIIVVAGLALQIIIFVAFVVCCVLFHLRLAKCVREEKAVVLVPWEAMLNMLYTCSVIISVRNVFRLVEYVMGKGSYLFANEWPVYVFDGALMLVVMVVYYVWYPDQLVINVTGNESMVELTDECGGTEEQEGRR
ncbi:RTA1 like protein-domain-containing protein [Phaeosphaeria sp. MPI-PUGE-AT-0046c]|nr:RTA1 like protein-domain-containing protein [Phaeosphaeria sp. MPI-PUGE-AT-0046c]